MGPEIWTACLSSETRREAQAWPAAPQTRRRKRELLAQRTWASRAATGTVSYVLRRTTSKPRLSRPDCRRGDVFFFFFLVQKLVVHLHLPAAPPASRLPRASTDPPLAHTVRPARPPHLQLRGGLVRCGVEHAPGAALHKGQLGPKVLRVGLRHRKTAPGKDRHRAGNGGAATGGALHRSPWAPGCARAPHARPQERRPPLPQASTRAALTTEGTNSGCGAPSAAAAWKTLPVPSPTTASRTGGRPAARQPCGRAACGGGGRCKGAPRQAHAAHIQPTGHVSPCWLPALPQPLTFWRHLTFCPPISTPPPPAAPRTSRNTLAASGDVMHTQSNSACRSASTCGHGGRHSWLAGGGGVALWLPWHVAHPCAPPAAGGRGPAPPQSPPWAAPGS